MARNFLDINSIPEKEVEVESASAEGMLKFCKPAYLYTILQARSKMNPTFLSRCLKYKIKAKRQTKSPSSGTVVFNYMDSANKILQAEVVKNFTCPFCEMPCGCLKGMQHHLLSSHERFDYKFGQAELDHHPKVEVSVKPDACECREEQGSANVKEHKTPPFSFCIEHRKINQKVAGKTMKRLNVKFPELDSDDVPRLTENEMSDVKAPHVSRRKQLAAERGDPETKRVSRLQSRQFYHSKTYQPMSLAEVMADADSEGEPDNDSADLNELLWLTQLKNVGEEEKQYMHLWNIFVRKERVFAYGQVSWACEEFTKRHAIELNDSLHFFWWWKHFQINLWDHSLILADTINKCSTILENAKAAPGPGPGPVPGPSTSQDSANGN